MDFPQESEIITPIQFPEFKPVDAFRGFPAELRERSLFMTRGGGGIDPDDQSKTNTPPLKHRPNFNTPPKTLTGF